MRIKKKIISSHALNVVDLKAEMVFIIISDVLIFRRLPATLRVKGRRDISSQLSDEEIV